MPALGAAVGDGPWRQVYSPYILHVRAMQGAQEAGFSLAVSCGHTPAIDVYVIWNGTLGY